MKARRIEANAPYLVYFAFKFRVMEATAGHKAGASWGIAECAAVARTRA